MKKSNKQPLVSVLMTVYNARSFLHEAVESIVNQSYKNFEFIIVDDGSTDGSSQIIREYSKKDSRIKAVFLKKNTGPSRASNVGLKSARGVYIARMDADDIAYPNRLEKQVDYLENNPDVVLLGGQCKLINGKGKVVGTKRFPLTHRAIYRSLFRINPIQHPSCMINTNLVGKNKISYKNHFILSHDLELVFDLARYGKLANLRDIILYYRQTPNSLSLKNPKETFKSTLKIRSKAVRVYGYKPNIFDLFVNQTQKILVALIPGNLIYPVFMFIRDGGGFGLGKIDKRVRKTLNGALRANFGSPSFQVGK